MNFSDKKLFISKINKSKFNELVKIKKKIIMCLKISLSIRKVTNNFLLKKSKKKINIISISNYSYDRGLDRIINIAKLFKSENKGIYFSLIGDYKIKSLKNLIIPNPYKDLKLLANKRRLDNMKFFGHKKNVIKYLIKANLLIYLPRKDSSWGRNIIEALSLGVPVITCGVTNTLIKK